MQKALTVGSPTFPKVSIISTRSNRIPAIALDLDKTIWRETPQMAQVEAEIMDYLNRNKSGITFSDKVEQWSRWEKLAVGDLEVNEEMLDFTRRLQKSGISVNVMTARSARIQESTLKLLNKRGFSPNEVFFRPNTTEGELQYAADMKVGWIRKSSDRYNYLSIIDDSESTVKAALGAGVPSALQPYAKGVDPKFLERSRGKRFEDNEGYV
ncbi:MAG: hypothetical protein FJZ43_04100 [Candidatus Staskawiczbacteria bacterium]|nr:hypothetical protein [Candidatus Staskawiczbacteria bacterium]